MPEGIVPARPRSEIAEANDDRVGRMVDAQEFENLTFRRERFSSELLEER